VAGSAKGIHRWSLDALIRHQFHDAARSSG
jgi:hypothetical protein